MKNLKEDTFYIIIAGATAGIIQTIQNLFFEVAGENIGTSYLTSWDRKAVQIISSDDVVSSPSFKFYYQGSSREFGLTKNEASEIVEDLTWVVARAGRRAGL